MNYNINFLDLIKNNQIEETKGRINVKSVYQN